MQLAPHRYDEATEKAGRLEESLTDAVGLCTLNPVDP
jgi:hypothetical protein